MNNFNLFFIETFQVVGKILGSSHTTDQIDRLRISVEQLVEFCSYLLLAGDLFLGGPSKLDGKLAGLPCYKPTGTRA
jgi:hypothetical protein